VEVDSRIEPGIGNCDFSEQPELGTLQDLSPTDSLHAGVCEPTGTEAEFTRNEVIYWEGDAANRLYKLVSGTVRSCRLLHDGRRQIGAFYLPGDIFGLEADTRHVFSAEAVTDCKVLVIRLTHREKKVLWLLMRWELRRAQNHLLLLAKTARERLATFLLEMAGKIQATDELELPMSREDIADYLGLTTETVSRIFTEFEHRSLIALPKSKRVMLRNAMVLKQLNA
jgi:CRP-like cAMP-binding protein